MPIYEYRCAKCGEFDVMQRITEKPLRKCPTCKGKVAKLISNTAFQLKGTGWYVTDYAAKSKRSTDGKPDGAPAEKGSAAEAAASPSGDAGKSNGSAAPKDRKSTSSGSAAPKDANGGSSGTAAPAAS